jgi:Ni,Fe-hydrogenase III large subunit
VIVPATRQTHRERLAAALAEGWRFADLHASADGSQVRILLTDGEAHHRIETVAVDAAGSVESIVDLVPAAGWDEREAHDLYGIDFRGHEPLRPLVDHDPRLDRWTVPVRGRDPYQIAVGPIHAGIIESGHFRFRVVGDRILHLDARLFYKHRGLEKAATGTALDQGIAFASRACAGCAVANGVAYAHACEDALGLSPTSELARARTVLLELERTWNHLNDISQICAGVGLAAGTTRFAGLTERARRLNAALTGHRFLFGSVQVGGSEISVPAAEIRSARGELTSLQAEAVTTWRELAFNTSFQDRLPDVGVVTHDDARRLGAVGPTARASGVAEDVRAASPRLVYDGFEPAVPQRVAGDVQARLEQRALELWQTFALLDRLLDDPIEPAAAVSGDPPKPIGVGWVESPRGATTCIVEHDRDRIVRLRLRTGSYANWPVVAHAAADNLLPDFPLINKSFELCYACADR